MIVDNHVHVVSADLERYPHTPDMSNLSSDDARKKREWLEKQRWIREDPFTVERLLKEMSMAGVDRAVLAPGTAVYGYDNSYAADSVRSHQDRLVALCVVDDRSADAAERLSELVESQGMSGLRLGATSLEDEIISPLWERAGSLRIPVCIALWPKTIPRLRHVLERFPEVPIVLDHLAHLAGFHAASEDELACLFELARFPNVFVKFSTPNIEFDKWPGAKGIFERVVERFGVRRMTWGSNHPASHEQSYKEQLDLARSAVSFLTADEQKWPLGETALNLWPALRGAQVQE